MALRLEKVALRFERPRAAELVDEICNLSGKPLIDPTPFRELVWSYVHTHGSRWSESTGKSFRAVAGMAAKHFGDTELGQLTKEHVAAYRDKLVKLGRSPSTVRQHIKFLRMVLATAVEADRIPANPADIRMPTRRPSPKQAFTWDQFRALLAGADGEWRVLILVAGLTGQRLRDCLDLRHEQIDREAGIIRFRRRKNDDWHDVPLHPAIASAITPGTGPVVPSLASLPATGSRSVSARFRDEILPIIGIHQPYAENNGGNKRVTAWSFHSFRHMLSTELNRMGVSQETRMAVVGHDDAGVSRGYTHAEFEDAKRAIGRLVI